MSDNERWVVYYDSSYPSSWIDKSLALEIAEWLGEKGFSRKNAEEVRFWIQKVIGEEKVSDTVLVFSQDVIPSTIMRDASSNNLIREYLDLGGAIVWFGDIPFFYGGLKDKDLQHSLQFWDMGSYSILGLTFARASSSARIKPTRGSKLLTSFYSLRPVRITVWRLVRLRLSRIRVRALAYTNLYPAPVASDVAPQRIVCKEEEAPLAKTSALLARGLETLKPFGLLVLLLLFLVGVLALDQLPEPIPSILGMVFDQPTLALLSVALVISLTASVYVTFLHEFYVSSWLITLGPVKGQILRLWDYAFSKDAKLSKRMKAELLYSMRHFVMESQ